MIRVRFLLKDGREICVVCKECEFERNVITDRLVSYELKGIKGEYPMYLRLEEVIAITKDNCKEEVYEVPMMGEKSL